MSIAYFSYGYFLIFPEGIFRYYLEVRCDLEQKRNGLLQVWQENNTPKVNSVLSQLPFEKEVSILHSAQNCASHFLGQLCRSQKSDTQIDLRFSKNMVTLLVQIQLLNLCCLPQTLLEAEKIPNYYILDFFIFLATSGSAMALL